MKGLPYVAAVLTFAAGLWQKWPCHSAGWPYDRALIFGRRCYSDLPVLLDGRALFDGHFPYAGSFEYPVIMGYLAGATAQITTSPPGYFLLNLLVLLACTLVTVWATIQFTGRMWAGLIVAASPVLALTGTINWDMIAVMFTSLALLAWARKRPALAGVAIGLGAATKLYPALLLFVLLVLAFGTRRGASPVASRGLRAVLVRFSRGRWRAFGIATVSAVAAWLTVNLPVMLFFPDGWLVFWRLNADRPADFGSAFYALGLTGAGVPGSLNAWSIILFGLCLAAIALWAPRRVEVLALLTVAAFLVTNKVYSPQYVLWLLPLAVVAGASLTAIAVWQLAESAYWWAIWGYLHGTVNPGVYAATIAMRIGAEIAVCVMVLANRQLLPGDAIGGGGHPARAEEVVGDIPVGGRA